MSWLKNTPEALASIPMDEKLSAMHGFARSADMMVIVTGLHFRGKFLAYVAEFGCHRVWSIPALSGNGIEVVYYLPIPQEPEA